MPQAFSVIMPFYRGDQADHFDKAIQSLQEQTLIPDEVVLIQDGPVSWELENLVRDWQGRWSAINWVQLPKNLGLSGALNAGIEAAQHEWLARMDADDICRSDRFEKQLALIDSDPELAILGSWIEEFDEEMKESLAVRRLPETDPEIRSYARWRCPFNHMTVMYRKSILQDLGPYTNFGAVGDDYELWARFIMANHKTANIQENLVMARAGNSMFKNRRRGFKYLRNEIAEINALYALGLLKPWHYVFHVLVKSIVRLSPSWMVRIFYKGIRSTS